MKKTDKAYIAGFFDGEGSIFISKSKSQYFLTVSIANTNLSVLENIQRLTGGGISKNVDNRKNNSPCFTLRLYCQEAKTFLKEILPYLMIKKEQAKLAIQFQSKQKMGKLIIPKKEQENYRIRINSFNKKSIGKKN